MLSNITEIVINFGNKIGNNNINPNHIKIGIINIKVLFISYLLHLILISIKETINKEIIINIFSILLLTIFIFLTRLLTNTYVTRGIVINRQFKSFI